MPHAVFPTGALTGTVDVAARSLVPGVEPGGSRAGEETKPALLIRDVWLEMPLVVGSIGGAAGEGFFYYLKLSQELDLSPGLILPVGRVHYTGDTTNNTSMQIEQYGSKLAGLIFAPRVVGIRAVEIGAASVTAFIHLDYERVDVPWMDWFIMWDFLDNIVDNEKEY